MSNIWLIFNNLGNFLYKTSDESRASISNIPTRFNATYIVKNPHITTAPFGHKIIYNLETRSVELTQDVTPDNPVPQENLEIHDYIELVQLTEQLKTDLLATIEELTQTKNELNEVSLRTTTVTNTVDSVFTNTE